MLPPLTAQGRQSSVFALIVLFSGCSAEPEPPKARDYRGDVTVTTINGRVTEVTVTLPNNQFFARNPQDAVALATQLETIVADLKAAATQFDPTTRDIPRPGSTQPEKEEE